MVRIGHPTTDALTITLFFACYYDSLVGDLVLTVGDSRVVTVSSICPFVASPRVCFCLPTTPCLFPAYVHRFMAG